MRSVQAITHFERSDLLTVMVAPHSAPLAGHGTRAKALRIGSTPQKGGKPYTTRATHCYAFFNCNNLYVPSQSWNYRGCWHQTLPLLDPHRVV